MSDPPKKFTFAFSKVTKKTNLIAPTSVSKEKTGNLQYIECLESKSIKLKNGEDEGKDKAPLVIPIVGPRKSSTFVDGKCIAEIAEDFSGVHSDEPKIKVEAGDVTAPSDSIEAQAIREILQEGADAIKEAEPSTLESLPSHDQSNKDALQKESSLEDYENIPVNQFGLAMLRGMGWKADEGIGKNKKVISVTAPVLRPKGMGLGADKMVLGASTTPQALSKKDEEQLKMIKGAYVKVTAGMHKEQYAQIEGFSDDSGRVILKMAIGGHVVSVNEASVLLVTKDEYSKNSKVLNATKFNEFKKREETGGSLAPDQNNRKKVIGNSRNHSQSPERVDSKKMRRREVRNDSTSPERSSKKKSTDASQSEKHVRKRSVSRSPERRRRHQSPSPKRYRSRSRSKSRDRYSKSKRDVSESDSDSKSHKKKRKKKKKNKEKRRRAHSSSSSEEISQSRSPTPKKKHKDKKCKKSRSQSPSSRRHR